MKDVNKAAKTIEAKEETSILITIGLTGKDIKKALRAYGKRNEESRAMLFTDLIGKVESTETITKPSQLVNAFCVECFEVDNISQARTGKHKDLKDIEAVQNFVTSWITFGEQGLELAAVNIKVARRADKKSSEESGDTVTFSKSQLIKYLEKLPMVSGVSNKAKALAFQLMDELV